MLEKIKQALRNAGLPENMANLIHVTQESEIEGAVSQLKQVFQDDRQREGDKRATEAQQTAVKNFKQKLGVDENAEPQQIIEQLRGSNQNQNSGGSPGGQQSSTGQNTGQPTGQNGQQGGGQQQQSNPNNDAIEALRKELEDVKNKLTEKEKAEQNTRRKNQFIKKLKDEKNIPESFAKAFAENVDFTNLDTDDKFNNYVDQVEKTVQEYDQERLSNSVSNNQIPGSGTEPEKQLDNIKKQAQQRYQGAEEGEGKEV